jgi:N-acetylmuramoyl-L-alanine amidase
LRNDRSFAVLVANADEVSNYLRHSCDVAVALQGQYGLFASAALAQGILESDYGTSTKAKNLNNHHGILCKADANYGEVGCRQDVGGTGNTVGSFAMYENKRAGYEAYFRLITTRKYYVKAVLCETVECYCNEIQAASYAGDDTLYAEKLLSIIERYDLKSFDIPKATKTVGMAQDNWLWILDRGHGKSTKGKSHTFNPPLKNGMETIYEWELNGKIVTGIAQRLSELGVPFALTVFDDSDPSPRKRAATANKLAALNEKCFLISIHHNAGSNENDLSLASTYDLESGSGRNVASGMESYAWKGSIANDFLKVLHENIEKELPHWTNRGIKKGNWLGLVRFTDCPAALCELGFFDNRTEAEFVTSDIFQQIIIESFVKTICFFGERQYVVHIKDGGVFASFKE